MTDHVVLKWDWAAIATQIKPTMTRNNELKMYFGLRLRPLFLNDIIITSKHQPY